MKVCVFADRGALGAAGLERDRIRHELHRVADTTDASELVVAVYLLNGHGGWKGQALLGGVGRAIRRSGADRIRRSCPQCLRHSRCRPAESARHTE